MASRILMQASLLPLPRITPNPSFFPIFFKVPIECRAIVVSNLAATGDVLRPWETSIVTRERSMATLNDSTAKSAAGLSHDQLLERSIWKRDGVKSGMTVRKQMLSLNISIGSFLGVHASLTLRIVKLPSSRSERVYIRSSTISSTISLL
jgi:hypothetical protein